MCLNIFFTLLTFCIAIQASNFPLYDGNLYEIASNADDQVLSVLEIAKTPKGKVTLEPWRNLKSQKWVAVGLEDVNTSENTFLLLPVLQNWDWNQFKNRTTLMHFDQSMPSLTIILNEDKESEVVDLQLVDKRPFQQWIPINVEGQEFNLLKNVGSGSCLKNTRGRPEMAVCNATDVRHQWNLKPLPLLSVSLAL